MLRVGDTFGDYRITGSLGAGGMGVVHTAHHLRLDRAVALKVLPPHLVDDPDYRARFLRESSTLAHLDSPHVVHVYDHGEVDGHLYLVTQLVPGGDLARRLRSQGPLPPHRALDVAAQVASALADAHASGVLHRDVKPSNVLLRDVGEDVFAYLCDFGIATRLLDPSADAAAATHLTQTGVVVGTYAYLAPERSAEGAAASVASDVYSLGCVLWAMLSGQAPYQGSSAVQVALNHVRADVPQLHPTHPWAATINPVLARAMAKDPGSRHDGARQLRAALLEALARGPVTHTAPVEHTVLSPIDAPAAPVHAATPAADTVLRLHEEAATSPLHHGAQHQPVQARPAARRGLLPGILATAGLVAVVAVGGAVGVAALGDGGGPTASPRQPDDTPAAAGAPTAAVAAPSAVAPEQAAPTGGREVTCWDGRRAEQRRSCGKPSGATGLTWVFPSFDPADPRCTQTFELDRPTVWECTQEVDGRPVFLRFSELVTVADARLRYNDEYGASARESVTQDGRDARYVWRARSANANGAYRLSTMYVDYPYSMSISASSPALRDAALQTVEFRAPQDVLGTS